MSDNKQVNVPKDIDGEEYIIFWRSMIDSGELEWTMKYGTEKNYRFYWTY